MKILLIGATGMIGLPASRRLRPSRRAADRLPVGDRGPARRGPAPAGRRRRCGQPQNRLRAGQGRLLTATDGTSFISAEDYAVALVDELEKSKAIRRRITVAY